MLHIPGEGVLFFCAVADVRYCCCCGGCDRYLISVRKRRHCCGSAFSNRYRIALFSICHGVFILRMSRSVICPLAVRRHNLQLGLILSDCQLTRCRALQRVVPGDICIAVLDGQAAFSICTVIVFADRRALGRCVGDRHGLVVHQARYGLLTFVRPAPAVLLAAGIRQCAVCHYDCQFRGFDCQCAGCISYHIILRYTCNCRLLYFCQIILRTICHMSNGRSIGQSRGDCGSICAQFTADSICSTQRCTVIGFTICLCRYSQRQCIIDSNNITISRYCHCLRRIIGVYGQILFLILSYRRCGILCSDSFCRCHIIRNPSCCSLQIMMYCYSSRIQFEVSIVCMFFINAITIWGWNKLGICTDMFCPIITCPIINDILI